MKRIRQHQIADILKCTQPNVSFYLRGMYKISLEDAIKCKTELKLPLKAWYDKDTQIKYFGKSYI